MSVAVKLYVYDLSNGVARQLSRQLTGRQIDGIWHTSVVVYGREIFYGQGINTTLPGRSHHGAPSQVIDIGETTIDEHTFNEYLEDMKEHYKADKYHLLDFNCNSFTNDCVGFLTGGSIPDFIKDLPTDFLSTPFGAALRPTIDAMYQRPLAETSTPPIPAPRVATAASSNPQLVSSILHAVAVQSRDQSRLVGSLAAPQITSTDPATKTLTAPIHLITNSASFHAFLRSHRAAVAFFTSATCGPCQMIEPLFERLAEEKGLKSKGIGGAGFAKVDIDIEMGSVLAGECGIKATPTFIFYLDGKKIQELKGADGSELRSQVDLLLFQAYPAHPHTSLLLPSVESLSLSSILFTQVPNFDTVVNRLSSFIDSNAPAWPSSLPQSPVQVKQALSSTVTPYFKARFAAVPPTNGVTKLPQRPNLPSATPAILTTWIHTTLSLTTALPLPTLFPLVDLWRLALLDPVFSTHLASQPPSNSDDPINILMSKAADSLQMPLSLPPSSPRNFIVTVLRLLSNAFSSTALARRLSFNAVSNPSFAANQRQALTRVLVQSLLHEDAAVRTAAASLAFNVAAFLQKGRVDCVRGTAAEEGVWEGEEEWEVEMVTAVVEALDRETSSEEVVHRLTACLAFLLRLSPFYETQLAPLLEVLQVKEVLKRKLQKGGCGENGVQKQVVRELVDEVAEKLCP